MSQSHGTPALPEVQFTKGEKKRLREAFQIAWALEGKPGQPSSADFRENIANVKRQRLNGNVPSTNPVAGTVQTSSTPTAVSSFGQSQTPSASTAVIESAGPFLATPAPPQDVLDVSETTRYMLETLASIQASVPPGPLINSSFKWLSKNLVNFDKELKLVQASQAKVQAQLDASQAEVQVLKAQLHASQAQVVAPQYLANAGPFANTNSRADAYAFDDADFRAADRKTHHAGAS